MTVNYQRANTDLDLVFLPRSYTLLGNANTPISEIWGTGKNNAGNLGLGDRTARSSPVQSSSNTWTKISMTSEGNSNVHSLAIKSDNSLFGFGDNTYGQLGTGNRTHYSSPIQVGSLTTWWNIETGRFHSIAIKTDGTLWGFGRNAFGELGQGNTTSYSSPVQVGALTDWSEISCIYDSSIAIKTDGTLWAWGDNATYGQLGLGDLTPRSSPVQVGALTDWSKLSKGQDRCVIAIKTDGTLWSWGRNSSGQLGSGTITDRSSPVQVGALTDWSNVSSGTHSLAIKTDGTLWSWGSNSFGQLGLGDRTDRSSPVQVGALTTWSKVSAGFSHSLAIKTDGTLWAWGSGSNGPLGQGNTTSYSSPVQIGALTTWQNISAGYESSLLTKSVY